MKYFLLLLMTFAFTATAHAQTVKQKNWKATNGSYAKSKNVKSQGPEIISVEERKKRNAAMSKPKKSIFGTTKPTVTKNKDGTITMNQKYTQTAKGRAIHKAWNNLND